MKCPHWSVQEYTECCMDCGENIYSSNANKDVSSKTADHLIKKYGHVDPKLLEKFDWPKTTKTTTKATKTTTKTIAEMVKELQNEAK